MTTTAEQLLLHPHATNGEFKAKGQSKPDLKPLAPTVDTDFIGSWLEASETHSAGNAQITDEITERVNWSRNFSDENIAAVADEVWTEKFGHTAGDMLAIQYAVERLCADGDHDNANSAQRFLNATSGHPAPPITALAEGTASASDPRVQAGQVFDRILAEDGTVFTRRQPGTFPDFENDMRLQASRKLTDDEMLRFAGLVGYAYRSEIRGEPMSDPDRDSPFSFVIGSDATKSSSDDIGMALERFEDRLQILIDEGSPIRTTDRSGPGTRNTRLIYGFGSGLEYELYYDGRV